MTNNQFAVAITIACLIGLGGLGKVNAQTPAKAAEKLTRDDLEKIAKRLANLPTTSHRGYSANGEDALRKKDYATAEKEFKKAIAAAQNQSVTPEATAFEYKLLLARVYDILNRTKEAYALYSELVVNVDDQSLPREYTAYAFLRYAAYARAKGDLDNAAWAANRATEDGRFIYVGGVLLFDAVPPFKGFIRSYPDLEAVSLLTMVCAHLMNSPYYDADLVALDTAESLAKSERVLAAIHFQRAFMLCHYGTMSADSQDDPTEGNKMIEKAKREYLAAARCDAKNRILESSFDAGSFFAKNIPVKEAKAIYSAAK